MIVSTPRPVRPYADLADVTTKEVLRRGWVTHPDGSESYEVQFAVNLTATEADAVRRRLATTGSVEETLQGRAWEATENLLAYESTATPTNVQTVAVVKLLCKVVRALIRLQLRRLDTTGDTTGAQPPTLAPDGKAPGRPEDTPTPQGG